MGKLKEHEPEEAMMITREQLQEAIRAEMYGVTGETRKRLNMIERLEAMIMEARAKGCFVRTFDVRYATEGIPELGEDHLYYPGGAGCYEVLETGNLSQPSAATQPLKYPKMLPIPAILLVELSASHKGTGNKE